MSYILDALRKADAERVRGAVPDLHSQPVLAPSSVRAPRPVWLLPGAAALALAVTVATLTWSVLRGRDAAAPVGVTRTASPVQAAVTASSPTPAPAPAPPVAAVRAAAPDRPVVAKRPAAASAALAPTLALALAQAPAPSAAPVAAPIATPAAEVRVYALNELPEPIRRDVPVLSVGGAMHSEHAANRMLILNGQVFHERDVIAPNLTLVQVQLKSALLEFRGYRYRITY